MKITRVLAVFCLIPLLVALPSPTLGQGYPEGMIAYWKFDEGAGAIASDSVGMYDGMLSGATWATGQVGGALSFDGNAWVELPTEPGELRVDMSWELWMKSSMNPAYKIVWMARLNEPGNPDVTCCYWSVLFVHFDAHYLHFVVAKPAPVGLPGNAHFSYLNSGAHYLDAEWHHLAVTKANTLIKFYVDGVLVAENDNPELNEWNTYTTFHYLGRTDVGAAPYNFEGLLDEVAVYDRVITPEEIQTHYENGLEGRGYEVGPSMTCVGFEPPMADYPVTAKKNRVLPLKANLFDVDGMPVFGNDLTTPPALQVWYEYETPSAEDVTDDSLPAGQGTEGNQFVFTEDEKWQFNLKTKDFTATGTYTVFMESSDSSYVLDPTCETQFVIK